MNVPRFLRRLFREPYDGYKHFAVVDEGVLYRCGQPTPEQLSRLIQEHGIKTVVSFRGSRDADDPDAWERAERAACEANGAHFETLPCNHKNPPTQIQVDRFLEIMNDTERRPVLVHCRIGQQRTMMFVALYWVHVCGMSPDDAEKKMDECGFNVKHYRHQRLLAAFREFTKSRRSATA